MIKTNRSIYLLPNLITSCSLFFGFLAIINVLEGEVIMSTLFIFSAVIMDILDGRIARLTKTESSFGAQYDSLADMLSFGVAPAIIIHQTAFLSLGKIGDVIAYVYLTSVALRLARFNLQSSSDNSGTFFQGLPSPAAAGFTMLALACCYMYLPSNFLSSSYFYYGMLFLLFTLSLLMISSLPYPCLKVATLNSKGQIFNILSIVLLILIMIYLEPLIVLLIITFLYVLSGFFLSGLKRFKRSPDSQ